MKKLVVLMSVLIAFTPVAALAEQQNAPAREHVDLDVVRKNIAPLATAFGVDTPKAETTDTEETKPEERKTLADVADRALGDVESVTLKIADTLQKLAPQVWRIMVKQQYAKAFSEPLGPLAWIIATIAFSQIGQRAWKRNPQVQEWDFDNPGNVFRTIFTKFAPLVIGSIATLYLVWALKNSVLYLVNPEYYAIQDLIRSIVNGGQVT